MFEKAKQRIDEILRGRSEEVRLRGENVERRQAELAEIEKKKERAAAAGRDEDYLDACAEVERAEKLLQMDSQRLADLNNGPLIGKEEYDKICSSIIEEVDVSLAKLEEQTKELLPQLFAIRDRADEIVTDANTTLERLQRDVYKYADCKLWRTKNIMLPNERKWYDGTGAEFMRNLNILVDDAGRV